MMAPQNHNTTWSKREILATGHLYLQGARGEQHALVRSLAEALGRTPGAIAWKIEQMVTITPGYIGKPIVVTQNVRDFMAEYAATPSSVAQECATAYERSTILQRLLDEPPHFSTRDGIGRLERVDGSVIFFTVEETRELLSVALAEGLADLGLQRITPASTTNRKNVA